MQSTSHTSDSVFVLEPKLTYYCYHYELAWQDSQPANLVWCGCAVDGILII